MPIWSGVLADFGDMCQFVTTVRQISKKLRIDMDTMFSLKIAQDRRLHFGQKIQKKSASCFFAMTF